MIDKRIVSGIVNEWLEDKEYFLVDVAVSSDDKIVVEIDHAEGVWIDDCVELSRFIESKLDREEEDYELEVGSAGIGQPFKVLQQYLIHIGQEVEVLTKQGQKLEGVMKDANEENFTVTIQKGEKKDQETAVEEIQGCEETETVIYDLTGRRVKEIAESGVYIINGQKVLVKYPLAVDEILIVYRNRHLKWRLRYFFIISLRQ